MISEPPLLALHHVGLTDALGLETILQDLSFTLSGGSFAAVVGASGAGKTSLLRLLNGLSTPTTGRITLAGRDLTTIPSLELRRRVVLVLQEPKLLQPTVAAALAYPLELQQLPAATIQARLERWRDRLSIPALWLDRREVELSVGQRQQVAIARALAMEPQLLLLDEPTSALDVGTAERVLGVLAATVRHDGLTILMVNHQLELVATFSDRALRLTAGRLEADQPTAAIDWPAWRADLVATGTAAIAAEDW